MGGVKLDVSGNRKCTWIEEVIIIVPKFMLSVRPAQLAELPRSKFDPELFPHSEYDKFL